MFWRLRREQIEDAKKEASNIQKIKDKVFSLGDKITEHIKREDKVLEEVRAAVTSCPEASHIKTQNGILRKQGEELTKQGKTQYKILGVLMFCGLLLSFLLYAVFSLSENKILKAETIVLEERVEVTGGK